MPQTVCVCVCVCALARVCVCVCVCACVRVCWAQVYDCEGLQCLCWLRGGYVGGDMLNQSKDFTSQSLNEHVALSI